MDILFPVLIAAGGMNVAAGIWFIRNVNPQRRDEVPCKVEVIDELVEQGDNGKVYRPVYRVVEGTHAGLCHRSEFAISPPIDRVGDIVDGILSPETGVVTSISMRKRSFLFGRIFLAVGVGAILIGLAGLIVSIYPRNHAAVDSLHEDMSGNPVGGLNNPATGAP